MTRASPHHVCKMHWDEWQLAISMSFAEHLFGQLWSVSKMPINSWTNRTMLIKFCILIDSNIAKTLWMISKMFITLKLKVFVNQMLHTYTFEYCLDTDLN